MTAHEQQDQRVVEFVRRLIGGWCNVLRRDHQARDGILAALASVLRAEQIGQPPRGDRDQPAEWIVRATLGWPAGPGGDQGFLGGVFGSVEMTVPSYQPSQDPRRKLAQQVLEVGLGRL